MIMQCSLRPSPPGANTEAAGAAEAEALLEEVGTGGGGAEAARGEIRGQRCAGKTAQAHTARRSRWV